ncbi:MAG: OmpA family protein [Phycisphaerae bacterium]|nr:OmpA family protein [Phycisphaerae bacterium]
MKRGWIHGVVLTGIVGLALMAGGCNEKEQILALQNKNEALLEENKNLRDQVIELERLNAQMKSDCDAKDMALASKNEELARLRAGQDSGAAEGWQSTTVGDKIAVGADLLFASGRATLTPAGQQALAQIVRDLKGQYSGLPIRVYGYTDSDPIRKSRKLWQDNLDLSSNRAMAVTRYLISRGVSAEDIETIGMGETHFVADNSSRDGKKRNRRVEIFVVKVP